MFIDFSSQLFCPQHGCVPPWTTRPNLHGKGTDQNRTHPWQGNCCKNLGSSTPSESFYSKCRGGGVEGKKVNCQSGKRTTDKQLICILGKKRPSRTKKKLEVQYKNVVSGCPKKHGKCHHPAFFFSHKGLGAVAPFSKVWGGDLLNLEWESPPAKKERVFPLLPIETW